MMVGLSNFTLNLCSIIIYLLGGGDVSSADLDRDPEGDLDAADAARLGEDLHLTLASSPAYAGFLHMRNYYYLLKFTHSTQ